MLHPWALAIGAAALAAPVLIHWLTRPRPARLPLSTIRFVIEVVEQRRARNRLRDWLILALRTAAVALLALAMARLLAGQPASDVSEAPAADVQRVVLLDVSQSMAAEHGSVRTFERARAIAARQLGYRSNLQANLILGGAAPQAVFDRTSSNFSALRDALAEAQPLPQRLNVQAALNRAAEMLARATGGANLRRELIVVSDFQRASWAAADFSALPVDTAIRLESAAAAEQAPANLGVLRVGPRGRVEQGREFLLEVELGNYAPAARKVELQVSLGSSVYQLRGNCPPGVVTTLSAPATLREPGWHVGEARLLAADDALEADDRRAAAVLVHSPPAYLLVTRQPDSSQPSSSYYLQRALAPYDSRDGRPHESVSRADPARLEPETLAAADLVVLDHPGKLAEPTIKLLASLLERGRGVLYAAAEPIDATNLNLLAKAAGANLQLPVDFAPPAGGQLRRGLFVADFQRRAPPFGVFGESALEAVAPLRFSGGLATRRREGALADDVRATFDDQSACLVTTTVGAGRLAILNADLGASNLAASPAFVPLVGELAGSLLGQDQLAEAAACGEPAAHFLPQAATADDLRIEGPPSAANDPGALGELEMEKIGVLWRLPAAGPPGLYRVLDGEQTVFALPAAIPAGESDLAPLASSVFTERLAGGRSVQFRQAALGEQEPRDDLWTWFAAVSVVCLIGEILGLKLFRA